MVTIAEVREVDASADEVWNIVSDVDRDSEYWNGLTSIRNIRRAGNMSEREVVVGFMGRKGTQRIELRPKKSTHLTMIDGPLRGSREITLVPLGERRTKIEVSWNIQFSTIPAFTQGFVRSHLEQRAEQTSDRITEAAQAASA